MSAPAWARVIQEHDRALFKRCRRAWDLGGHDRRDLVPVQQEGSGELARALGEALAVYYFPGMWEWPRDVVEPLVREGFLRALPSGAPGGGDEARTTGLALLERYFAWAPTVDRFTPVRVATDFEVGVPDPRDANQELTTGEGRPIRFRGRVDLLVIDPDDHYWIVAHRLTGPDFADLELLLLDEGPVTACWAWERHYLGMRVAGTIANELRPSVPAPAPGAAPAPAAWHDRSPPVPKRRPDRSTSTHRRMYAPARRRPGAAVEVVEDGTATFRRTQVPRAPASLAVHAARLAEELAAMVDPSIALYPSPSPANCGPCPFRRPCVAESMGDDPAPILAGSFRARDPEREAGRLGGVTWSMNRGAAPPRFRADGGGPR